MVVHRRVFRCVPPLLVLALLATAIAVGNREVSLASSMGAAPAARESQRDEDSHVGRVLPPWWESVKGLVMVWCLFRLAVSSVSLQGRDVVVRTLRWLVRGSYSRQSRLVQPLLHAPPPAHGFHGCVLQQPLFRQALVLVREGDFLAVREFAQ